MLSRRLCCDEVRDRVAGRALVPLSPRCLRPMARPRRALAGAIYLVCNVDQQAAYHAAAGFLLDEPDSASVAHIIERSRLGFGLGRRWRNEDCPSGVMLAGAMTVAALCANPGPLFECVDFYYNKKDDSPVMPAGSRLGAALRATARGQEQARLRQERAVQMAAQRLLETAQSL